MESGVITSKGESSLKQGQSYALANVQQEPASGWQRFLQGRVPNPQHNNTLQ